MTITNINPLKTKIESHQQNSYQNNFKLLKKKRNSIGIIISTALLPKRAEKKLFKKVKGKSKLKYLKLNRREKIQNNNHHLTHQMKI
jgi:hypothetical protein